MDVKKILFINTETSPYVPETKGAMLGKQLPEAMQSAGCEIRTFMPKWGPINERRGQLHEVIRLSGMNIIVDDTDHPLIIKVASIPVSRVQVYFIDNEDYFTKRGITGDDEGNDYQDNGERAIFFARGVLETVKKLRWTPDVIHCQGWMSTVVPFYLKTAYQDEPCFKDVKVVSSLIRPEIKEFSDSNFKRCLEFDDMTADAITGLNDTFGIKDFAKFIIDYSDAIVAPDPDVEPEIIDYVKSTGKPLLVHNGDDIKEKYSEFYKSL